MSTGHRLRIELRSALLVGGHEPPRGALDAATARDHAGRPYIPASTLRGAIREACFRLLRSRGQPACTPFEPCPAASCALCRIFGAPGVDRPLVADELRDEQLPGVSGAPSGRLRIGPAVAAVGAPTSVRPGVAIDRMLRSAALEVLFQREVLDAPSLVLAADVEGDLQSDEWALLRDALPFVDGLGNSRTRGLGRVRIELEGPSPRRTEPWLRVADGVGGGLARVVITPVEPLVLGGIPTTGSVHRTHAFIPGSALRGALAVALLRAGVSRDDPSFRGAFMDPATCLRFSDAFPTEGDVLPLPVPRSTVACKKHGGGPTGRVGRDMLVVGALASHVLEAVGGAWRAPVCATCGRPLQPVEGWIPPVAVRRRVITRLARDPYTGASAPGMLYAMEQIEPTGIRFVGTVAGLDAARCALLRRAAHEPVRIGRGANRGMGTCRIEIDALSPRGVEAVRARRQSFERAVAPLLEAARRAGVTGLPADPRGLLAVLARTDLAVSPADAPGVVAEAVFGTREVRLLAAHQAAGERSGWDLGHEGRPPGPRPLVPVVRAGSVWLFQAPDGVVPADERLARVEEEGVGDLRCLGLGQLVVDPDVLRPEGSA
ncbi:MAG: RAMP superfamily CRISPR-associated protein [Myxococcota bacterium]|nr:RAMP superfamily CRISPR-associated protein [Myxococcota bacterium]